MAIYGNIIGTNSVEIDTGANSGNGNNANYWIKVAEADALAYDKASAVIGIDLDGKSGDFRAQAVVYLQHGDEVASRYDIAVDIIDSSNTTNPFSADDFVLTYSTGDSKSQLWVRSSETYMKCYAAIIQGSKKPDDTYTTGYELTVGSSWQASITSLGAEITATHTDREFNNLTVSGNISDLTFTNGATIANSDANTLTVTESLTVLSGDLQVNGNDIKSGTGNTAISLSGADVTVAGDLRVNGTEVLGPVDNHLQLRSDTSMYFDIDRDDDGTDQFYWRKGSSNSVIMQLDESGNLNVTGDVLITDTNSDQSSSPTLTLRTSDSGVNDGSVLRFDKRGPIEEGDNIGEIYFYGSSDANDTNWYPGAAIVAEAEANWNPGTSHPTSIKFATVSGNGDPTEQMWIYSNGDVKIAGDLTVSGNDIKSNTGDTAISLNSNDVTVSGRLSIGEGITSNLSVKVSSGYVNTANYWIKIASTKGTVSAYDTTFASFLVMFTGTEYSTSYDGDFAYIVNVKFTPAPVSPWYYSVGTYITVEPLHAGNLEGFDPVNDVAITFDNTAQPTSVELWVRSKEDYKECFVTYLGGSNNSDGNIHDTGFEILTGQAFLASITSLGQQIYGQYVDKIFGDLTVGGSFIDGPTDSSLFIRSDESLYFEIDNDGDSASYFIWRNGGNSTIMSLDESGNLQFDGDLTVTGNNIKSSTGATAITLSGADVTIAGDLTVAGTSIWGPADNYLQLHSDTSMYFDIDKDDGGTEQFYWRQGSGNSVKMTLNESGNLYTAGDLTVAGNDIKDSGSNTVLSFDGSGRIDNTVVIRGTTAHKMTLWESDTDGTAGPELRFYRNKSDGLASGDNIGEIWFYGSENDTNFAPVACFFGEADDNFALNSNHSGRLVFYTAEGSGNPSERMRINRGGNVIIGHTGDASSFPGSHTGKLAVKSNTSGGSAAEFWHDGNATDRYGISICAGTDDNTGTNYHIIFQNGAGSNIGYITSSGGTMSYGQFTGVHYCSLSEGVEDYPYGTVLKVLTTSTLSEKQVSYICEPVSTPQDKTVFGVYGGSMVDGPSEESNLHQVFCLGDGHILVCSEGGNIEAGDYICSSSTSGHGMKQSDDLLHNYTVAKATEGVDWSSEPGTTKLISCTYHSA